ncbi:pentatricopeptide repeat-containing protein At1g06270 [Ziziphus jujuba]|uniref:Pentatricopeptide repeat-containing protein At1g06270 n=2 Tax=Ziziphus jujuba TaxID=326968 RepID=A0A6P3ZFZ9_ZIZJJ|nr:pentatricopeptide repeat-containing protein At1g06270 [Ziziphus jujuba]XP_024926003.2 pentatricopeptide repeat-containing protein At1g06270 [Ziziphus jujuba]XP_024926004.2 pentatricopeptide repeat-containing protein At1g06270 [Ziziphus jujuba var. spinosa]KAH7533164.1 hypothetical protein FEM48_Zijuj04G0101300 [Ziziphus jujuba var. spinosa]
MASGAMKFCRTLLPLRYNVQYCLIHSASSSEILQETIEDAVKTKSYEKIPDVLTSHGQVRQHPNPFSFLSTYPPAIRAKLIDEILQSFVPVRPRYRSQIAFSCLLSYTLQSPNPLPISLAILQRTLRSGCVPAPQTHLLLSSAWLRRRRQSQSVAEILLEMQSIGYSPDSGTCNYLILSLCAVDQLMEAVKVLKGLSGAGCVPDLESYNAVISSMCKVRRTTEAVDMIKQMVVKVGLAPRQGTLVKVMATLRANREMWRAVEVVELLERERCAVGFEIYESVVEGCLECGEFILSGKVVIGMTDRGFIPYIKVRQKVVERLAGIGEWKLACAVRQRFADLKS